MSTITAKDMELTIDSSMFETLLEVEGTLRRHFEIQDWEGVRILLAAAASHYLKGETLWLRFLGPSRSGRTELLRAIAEHVDCVEMEVLTPAALRGGFRRGSKVLERINGKLVITKDIASILTARKDLRNEVFGVLRGVKDGKLTSDFGSDEGRLEQQARFDWILAATNSGIEQNRNLDGLLGQRFIDLRLQPGNREIMAFKAASNNPKLGAIREELSKNVISLLLRVEQEINSQEYDLSEAELKWIAKVADLSAILRTPIQIDRQGHVVCMPEPEIGTELAQGFSKIAKGLKCLGLQDFQPYIRRLCLDCVPSIRVKLFESLVKKTQLNVDELAELTGIPKRTVYYVIEQMEQLHVVKDDNGYKKLSITLP